MSVIFISPVQAQDVPPALQYLIVKGNAIKPLPEAHGLRGFLITKGDESQPIYLTPDGDGLIAGLLFNSKGANVTALQLEELEKQKKSDKGNQIVFYLKDNAYSFVIGSKGPEIIVFVDPLCEFCHNLFTKAAPLIQKEQLVLRVIPVGLINPTKSSQLAAHLISTETPDLTWLTYEASLRQGSSSSTPSMPPSEEALSIILKNNKAFFAVGFTKTPSLLYLAKDGNYKVFEGVPTDITKLIN